MHPLPKPGNEPDANDMSSAFDPEADTRPGAPGLPEPGEEEFAPPADRA